MARKRGTEVGLHFNLTTPFGDLGEKGLCSRLYRRFVDGVLARHHRLVDFFFSMAPLEPPGCLQRIFSLAYQFVVEVETHPVNQEEYRFLVAGEIFRRIGDVRIAPPSALPRRGRPGREGDS